MRLLWLLLVIVGLVSAQSVPNAVAFANQQCNQNPEWECAEFTARSIANGGFISGLSPWASTDVYGNWHGFNLRVVEPLHDYLRSIGWVEASRDASSIQAGMPIFGDAGDGPWSHACIGVAPGKIDCHNNAACGVPANEWFANGVNSILSPPAPPPPPHAPRSDIAFASDSGRVSLYAAVPLKDLAVYTASQNSNSTSTWGAASTMQHGILASESAAVNEDGRVEVLGVSPSGQVFHAYQTAPEGPWTGWETLQGTGTMLRMAPVAPNGVLEALLVGGSGSPYYYAQVSTGSSSDWLAPVKLSGSCASVQLTRRGSWGGQLVAWCLNGAGQLFASAQQNGSSWGAWVPVPGLANVIDFTVAENTDLTLQIVYMSGPYYGGPVSTIRETQPGGSWSAPSAIADGAGCKVSAGRNADGRLEVMLASASPDFQLYHIWQETPGGPWASAWAELTGACTRIEVTPLADGAGHLNAACVGLPGGLYVASTGSSGWTSWRELV